MEEKQQRQQETGEEESITEILWFAKYADVGIVEGNRGISVAGRKTLLCCGKR